jgi:MoaA/NifB/PqqE/SkfB family radical SAM enzyme
MNNSKYGFQKHLSPEFPSQIIVDVTEHCNLACIHCPHSEFAKSKAFTGANLDIELHKKLINEVATDGLGICQYLRYAPNGEPLLHPQIEEMLEYACKNSKTRVNLTTNGMLLTKLKAKKLLDIGVDIFDISIDAFTNETYKKIRVNGKLDVTRENVLGLINLIKKYNYKTKVVVSFVEQPLNKNETLDFEKFWKDNGAHYVVIRRLHSAGGAKKTIKSKMDKAFKNIARKPCVYPWERLVLTPKGTIGFCPGDWYYKSEITNFKNHTIKEIWQGDFMKKLREAHLKNNFSEFVFCGQCPDWVQTRWPEEGRAYINMMKELIPNDLLE